MTEHRPEQQQFGLNTEPNRLSNDQAPRYATYSDELRARSGGKKDGSDHNWKHIVGAGTLAAILAVGSYSGVQALRGGGSGEASASGVNPTPAPSAEVATPTPSMAAGSASPEATPSASPEANVQSFVLGIGEKQYLPAGTIISGDVAIADQDGGQIFRLYDIDTDKAPGVTDNTQTALIVDMQAPGEVYSPYGAFVVTGLPQQRADNEVQLLAGEKQGSFAKVDVVDWTGFATTVNEVGKTAAQDSSAVMSSDSLAQQGGLTQPFESATPGASAQPTESPVPSAIPGAQTYTLPSGEVVINIYDNDNCGCLPKPTPTPTPECTATPSPVPTQTPEATAQCVPMYDDFLKNGQTVTLKGKDFLVQGDVYIDGVRHFDSSGKTGAIDKVLDGKTHKIYAPYGADVQVFNSCATEQDMQNTYNNDLKQLKAGGRTLDPNSFIKN